MNDLPVQPLSRQSSCGGQALDQRLANDGSMFAIESNPIGQGLNGFFAGTVGQGIQFLFQLWSPG
jgi:hypothetical protein